MHRCIGGVDGIQISDRIIVWYREYAHALWCMGWVSERVIYSVHVMSHYIIPAAVAIASRLFLQWPEDTLLRIMA